MLIKIANADAQASVHDHRVEMAQKKREKMRSRIVEATTKVFMQTTDDAPVIEDVVREAGISRGTFYKYFDSLDEALVAAGVEANDRMIADIASVYAFLNEPWQRASVGFRIFMVRALQEPGWAAFITRMDAWPHESMISIHMTRDLQRGKELGQFRFDDEVVANDFLMGASAGSVQAVRRGVPEPQAYIDSSVRMMLQALGCNPELTEKAVDFSRNHIAQWLDSKHSVWSKETE
jgi:AcrR family transcriptional regulator